jgi:hypothetical protein
MVRAERFKFRLRFEVSRGRRITLEEDELLLHEDDSAVVWLRTLQSDSSLEHADTWVLMGSAYSTEDEAVAAGEYWRGVLERSFAVLGVCADFGDYAAKGGGFSAAVLKELNTASEFLVANETFGIMVFPDDVPVLVSSASATGYAGTPPERFTRALVAAQTSNDMTTRERLAFDLYSAADFVSSRPEARFVLLMMALEALIEVDARGPHAQEHIDALIRLTEEVATLDRDEADSLKNALRSLKRESVRHAGRRLIAALDGRHYDGKTALTFFNECYGVRSALVHGAASRPSRDRVSRLAANLHLFVGHLIAGRALLDAVEDPSAP